MSKQSRKLLILLVAIELYFLLPLLVCGLSWYKAARAMRQSEVAKATVYTKLANPFFQLSNVSYKVARPALWVFRLSTYTDRAMRIAGYVNRTALTGTEAAAKMNAVLPLMIKKDKTADDQRALNTTMAYLKTVLPPLSQNLLILALETQNSQIRDFAQTTKFLSSVVAASDTIGGNKKEGRFLVLFLNDKELRPGGGFIGSYGIVTLGHYSVQNIEIHDVYDADGQLKEHVDPPEPVRTYLQNPHWFLRDSNFSADFKENAGRAEWFLGRELGAPPFDGIIGITTTTIENIIGAYGSVTLADSGDVITKENFYEKTQAKAQENFFPGSRQKQTTLSSLSQALMLQLDSVSKEALATVTRRMLREKQMVVYMKDPSIQSILEEYHWAGRIVKTDGDYLYPVEANVGVNKVNSYTKRSTNYEVRIVNNKPVKHIYTTQFDNTYNGSMPANNIYKNYFQLYIPKNALVETVLVDGGRVNYQVWPQNDLIAPAVYVEVPPQSSKKITVIYTTPPLVTGSPSSTYHLSVQKQVGSENSPFTFSIALPKGSSLLSKDFDAEVQGVTLKHQAILSEDRAFEMTFTSQ